MSLKKSSTNNMKKHLLIILSTLTLTGIAHAQMADTTSYGSLKLGDNPQSYDQLARELIERNNQTYYEDFRSEFIDIDVSDLSITDANKDDVYAQRIKMMATEIQLPYNAIVKRFIDVYTRPSGTMTRVLGLGQYYFPMIESILYENDLPMELKMLPVIESAMIVRAKSRASAVGLWQFMLPTAKYYGLEINSFVDERQDPVKSTQAACKYLKDLYGMYNDWTLVIAAYNCGQGNVNKALRRVPNAKSYWDIWDYLPSETRNYVPIFIAASYAYTFHKAHGIEPAENPLPLSVDTVMVSRMMHLDQVATTLDVPSEIIKDLNPQYLKDIVPATSSAYKLILPMAAASKFAVELDSIYAKDTIYLSKYQSVDNLKEIASASSSSGSPRVTYKVKSGDTLGHIAVRYNTTVKKLQQWNGLRTTKLKIGQRILIY